MVVMVEFNCTGWHEMDRRLKSEMQGSIEEIRYNLKVNTV